MKHADLPKTLLEAARSHPPSDHVPFGFEHRIMAHIRALGSEDPWLQWTRALWRAAAPAVMLALALGVWTSLGNPINLAEEDGFETAIENTVLSSVDASESIW